MALKKDNANINFSKGLETKSDPKQIPPGNFLALSNTVFSNTGALTKRNGFAMLPSLPDSTSQVATTFNGNLLAIGDSVQAYSQGSNSWVDKGSFNSCELTTLPLIRSSLNQSQCDTAIAANGLICTVYTDTGPTYKYAVADSVTGQNIVAPTEIPVTTGAVTGGPRVFTLGKYFVIVFNNLISATNHLQYIAINTTVPSSVTVNADISASYDPSSNLAFDGFVANNSLYLAWNGADVGGAIRVTYLSATLTQGNTVTFPTYVATHMSVSAVTSGTPVIYVSFYDDSSSDGYTLAVNQNLVQILAPTQIINGLDVLNITSSAESGVCTVLYEIENAYTYDSGIASNYVDYLTVSQGGTVSSATTILRSVGLASKSFILDSVIYVLTVYGSSFQPTFFLTDLSGNIVSKLAYSNGGGYLTLGLPSVHVDGDVARVSYLVKDLISSVNKAQGAANAAGVYSQTGVNLCSFNIGTNPIISCEIGSNLNLIGGFLWMYDGYVQVENGFFVWPDSVEVDTVTTGGNLEDQEYFYVATYEWADNQGNVFRSAPSIPVSQTTTGGDTSKNTINVPTLRLTYKTQVKIVLYRWSTAQQTYYQVTSLTSPTMNNKSVDYVAITDGLADSAIIGNNILYTTGGVVENISPPACIDVSLFQSRLFLIDAENKNLLWYAKQVIQNTPVEMSDLFTIFVAPTTGAQGSTGSMNFTVPMDDKLIIFKNDALYYITGKGPDNTGANNDFSEPIFITATVGSNNKKSIVFIPQGLMFQSDKGIWLLGRDLSTTYIGAPVQLFNDSVVVSAINVPGTNQVRFSLDNGVTLMYDYFEGQWGTFIGISNISSTLYQGLHTYINSFGQVFQENPNSYLDGSNPVLLSFKTGWFNLAGLQGYERAYYFYLLGQFFSPHKIQIQIAFDYAPSPSQSVMITPDNYNAPFGGDELYGHGTPYGGTTSLEQWRVFFQNQKCQAFQITLNEIFDSSYGVPAGAGFTLSGLNLIFGLKKGYVPIFAKNSVG